MNLTVIVPVHEFDESVKPLFDTALTSLDVQGKEVDILVVVPESIQDKMQKHLNEDYKHSKLKIKIISNTGDTDFQSQINLGVENTETKYFSFLEFDDEVDKKYLQRIDEYVESYDDVDMFLTTVVQFDAETNKPVGTTNLDIWSKSFVGDNGRIGFLSENILKEYSVFSINGAAISVDHYKKIGGLKKNIKLSFVYEFLLRSAQMGSTIFVIPKYIYKHVNGREGSLFSTYNDVMSMVERKFWFDTAKRESHFTDDRTVEYVETKMEVTD